MTYDLDKYVEEAIRTESQIEQVVVDPNLLASVMQIFIASGNMLDQIKKHVFYGKDYDAEKMTSEFVNIVGSLDQLKPALSDMQQYETKLVPNPNESIVVVDPRVFHALIGIATESTELMEALASVFAGGDLDSVNILEEFGDLDWYEAIGIDALGGSFGQVLDTNNGKLRKRFPEKFTSERAINRDTDEERKLLENDLQS